MAKNLADAVGIVADSNYPTGYKIVDGQTVIGSHINQDIIQFFQKLMDNRGIPPNDLDDNEVNGYQFLDALKYYVEYRIMDDYTHYKRKVILPIGNWNMTTTENRAIPHLLSATEWKTVGDIDVIILADNVDTYGIQPLNSIGSGFVVNGGVYYVSDENINIIRNPSGEFATLGRHVTTPYNRGFVSFTYLKDL